MCVVCSFFSSKKTLPKKLNSCKSSELFPSSLEENGVTHKTHVCCIYLHLPLKKSTIHGSVIKHTIMHGCVMGNQIFVDLIYLIDRRWGGFFEWHLGTLAVRLCAAIFCEDDPTFGSSDLSWVKQHGDSVEGN